MARGREAGGSRTAGRRAGGTSFLWLVRGPVARPSGPPPIPVTHRQLRSRLAQSAEPIVPSNRSVLSGASRYRRDAKSRQRQVTRFGLPHFFSVAGGGAGLIS